MSDLDEELENILDYLQVAGTAEVYNTYTPESLESPKSMELRPSQIERIKQAFIDNGWVKSSNSKTFQSLEINGHLVLDGKELMTGQEWYDKFLREYRLRADWIGGDEDMGEDAEHDVLFAARMASGVEQ